MTTQCKQSKPTMTEPVDIGEVCIDCHRSVAWGSGWFVNRIPAWGNEETGWMCAECQHDPDTDECDCDSCAESRAALKDEA